jgi:lysyl-tRNA synthetase class 2
MIENDIDDSLWKPTASIDNIKLRADTLRKIRNFFFEKNILEVETPLLTHSLEYASNMFMRVTNNWNNDSGVLINTPEYNMVRLMSTGIGPIYQICKSFRTEPENDESLQSKVHNPEFTMVEWYRHSDMFKLMDDLEDLFKILLPNHKCIRRSFKDVFYEATGFDPHTLTMEDVNQISSKLDIEFEDFNEEDMSLIINILLDYIIYPVNDGKILFVYDWPECLRYLCDIDYSTGYAKRFEVYIRNYELANGGAQLVNYSELNKIFDSAKDFYNSIGGNSFFAIPYDKRLLSAVKNGIPECSGVGLGLDRLLMSIINSDDIDDVLSFPYKIA